MCLCPQARWSPRASAHRGSSACCSLLTRGATRVQTWPGRASCGFSARLALPRSSTSPVPLRARAPRLGRQGLPLRGARRRHGLPPERQGEGARRAEARMTSPRSLPRRRVHRAQWLHSRETSSAVKLPRFLSRRWPEQRRERRCGPGVNERMSVGALCANAAVTPLVTRSSAPAPSSLRERRCGPARRSRGRPRSFFRAARSSGRRRSSRGGRLHRAAAQRPGEFVAP